MNTNHQITTGRKEGKLGDKQGAIYSPTGCLYLLNSGTGRGPKRKQERIMQHLPGAKPRQYEYARIVQRLWEKGGKKKGPATVL